MPGFCVCQAQSSSNGCMDDCILCSSALPVTHKVLSMSVQIGPVFQSAGWPDRSWVVFGGCKPAALMRLGGDKGLSVKKYAAAATTGAAAAAPAAAAAAAAAAVALCVLRCQSGLEEPPNSGLVEIQRSSKKAVCSEWYACTFGGKMWGGQGMNSSSSGLKPLEPFRVAQLAELVIVTGYVIVTHRWQLW